MRAIEVLTGALLIGCLIPAVTLSPIKDKKDGLVPQSSRLRVKTIVRAGSNQRTSPNNRFYPDPNSPVAHFDSRPIQPSSEVSGRTDHQFTQQKESSYDDQQDFNRVTQSINKQVTPHDQHFQVTVATSTQAPIQTETRAETQTTSNFGDRIQKNDQDSKFSKCLRKGSCSTITFTSGEKVPASSDAQASGNKFDKSDAQSTVTSSEQQYEHGKTQEPKRSGVFEFEQNRDVYEGDRQVPNQSNFGGQVTTQDDSQFTQSHVQSFQDEQFHTTQGFLGDQNGRVFNEQNEGSFRPSYDTQSQFNTQRESQTHGSEQQQYDDSFSPQVQNTYDGQDGQGNTFSSGVSQQQHSEGVAPGYEVQQKYEGDSQFQHSVTQDAPASFVGGSHESQIFGTQQISGQSGVSHASGGSHQGYDDGQYYHHGNPLDWLRYSVPGAPGEDYPIFYQVPATSFDCKQQQFSAGIFGDTEASCQVFHICKENGGQASFLCPNGTVFNQQYFVCDWWYNYRCSDTPSFYNLNSDLYWDWESFTPSQVINGPSGVNGQLPNYQSGSSGNFDRISVGNVRHPIQNEGQNQAVQSTIAVDNSAIIDQNRNDFEQRFQDDVFPKDNTALRNRENAFQNTQRDFHQQIQQEEYPSSFTSDFTGTTAGFQSVTVSPISSNFENVPGSFSDNSHQNENNFYPASSDTGANRRPGSNTGTNYPDQNGYGQQFTNVFQTQEQSEPAFGVNGGQHNLEFPNKDGDVKTQERPVTQDFVSVSFDNQNRPLDDTPHSQSTQSDFERGRNTVAPFDISQQTSSDYSGENYDSQTQELQQEQVSFDGHKPDDFSANRNDNIRNTEQSIFHRQDQDFKSVVKNEDNRLTTVNDIQNNQDVQQEYISSPSFENTPASFDTGNQDVTHSDNSAVQNQGFPFDVNQQSILSDDDRIVDTGINQAIQQQTISNSFEDNGQNAFDLGSNVESSQSDKHSFGSSVSGISQGDGGSPQVQQEYIPTSVEDQRKDILDSRGGGHNTNIPHVSNQKENAGSFQTVNQDSQINEGDFNRHSGGNNQNLQQEHISSSFNGNEGSAHDSRNRGNQGFENSRTRGPEIVQTNDESSFTRDRTSHNQQEIKNLDVQQEYVSAGDNFENNHNQRGTFFNGNQQQPFVRTNEDNRNNQVFQQEHISNAFDGNRGHGFSDNEQSKRDQHIDHANRGTTFAVTERPNAFENRVNFPHDEQRVQQENTVIFPDAGTSPTFNPENNRENYDTFITTQDQTIPPFSTTEQGAFEHENRGLSHGTDRNQQKIQFEDVQQKDVTNSFVETRPNDIGINENYRDNHPNDGFVRVQNQESQSGVHNQKTFGDSKIDGQNTPDSHIIQQEHTPTSFESTPSNNFGGWRGVTNQPNQGFTNVPDQGRRFQTNPQNTFGLNGQQNVHFDQNFNQEHVNIPFVGNQEHNINAQNIFIQGEHRGQGQIQQQHQIVSFDGNNQNSFGSGIVDGNQNTNAAFEMRLNNFRPGNIHEMGRGGAQDRNYMQQRMSFRPYGPNQQNNVNNHQIQHLNAFASGQQQSHGSAFSNQKSPSNQNFFVTNGHQVRDEKSQIVNQQSVSGDLPINNVQGQSEQFPHITQQHDQDQANKPLIINSNDQRIESQKSNNVHFPTSTVSGNEDTRSQVKGYTSNYRNGRSVDFIRALNSETNSHGTAAVLINANDALSYNQPEPQSTEINYTGWKPVVKF